jgi:hypothetical protein
LGEKVRSTLKIGGLKEEEAHAVVRALRPDNVGLPDGCSIKLDVFEGGMTCTIVGRMEIGSLMSTLNDLMTSLRAADGSLKAIRNSRQGSGS